MNASVPKLPREREAELIAQTMTLRDPPSELGLSSKESDSDVLVAALVKKISAKAKLGPSRAENHSLQLRVLLGSGIFQEMCRAWLGKNFFDDMGQA